MQALGFNSGLEFRASGIWDPGFRKDIRGTGMG